jgi:hypothetical protein
MFAIPETESLVTADSAPPAIITSASPSRMSRIASTIASTPEAHAAVDVSAGPRSPNEIDI